MKEKIKGYLLAFVSSILVLFIMEFFVSKLTDVSESSMKITIRCVDKWGHCYPSDERNVLPINLKIASQELENFKAILLEPEINSLLEKTPHCVLYNEKARREGWFPEKLRQVFIIGDSFAFGEGVGDEDTIGYLLSKEFLKINFRNFAQSGANIKTVYDHFLDIIEHNAGIEGIVYFYNLNDVLISQEIAMRQKFIIDFQNLRWHNYNRKIRFFKNSALLQLLERSCVLHKESNLTTKNYLDMYFNNDEKLKETENMLKSMSRIAKEHGINFYIVILPLFYKDILGRYPFVKIHALLSHFCKENGISCIDTYEVFKKYYSLKRFTVNPIDYHPNGIANKMIVSFLADSDRLSMNK